MSETLFLGVFASSEAVNRQKKYIKYIFLNDNRLRGKVSLFHLHKLKKKENELAATIIRKINKPSHVKSRTALTFTHRFPSIFKSSFKVLQKKKKKKKKNKKKKKALTLPLLVSLIIIFSPSPLH